MTTLFSKINKLVIGLLLLAFVLAPAQSLAISSFDHVAIERSRCISIYNSANYLEAATCFGNLFNNSLNTERFKDLNNKTVALRGFNGVCIDKYNRADYVGARDCFASAITLACSTQPVIDDHCVKFINNLDVAGRQSTFNNTNFALLNQQLNELTRCNGIYRENDLNGAFNCYQSGIANSCNKDSLLDELCGKFRNNANTAQREINDCYYNNNLNYNYDYSNNYNFSNYNYKCSKVVNNTSDTVKIFAGVATAAVLACVFFCGGSSTNSNPGDSSNPGNYNNYYYNSGGSF